MLPSEKDGLRNEREGLQNRVLAPLLFLWYCMSSSLFKTMSRTKYLVLVFALSVLGGVLIGNAINFETGLASFISFWIFQGALILANRL